MEPKTKCTRNFSKSTLELFVDTTIKTTSTVDPDSSLNYHSYLITMKNVSDSNVFIGYSNELYFINREAKDKSGRWVKIDKKLQEMSMCGTGQPFIYLRPGEFLISKVKRYKGNMVTDFRLVFGYHSNIVYSNVFRDSIDEKTFQLLKGSTY
ncbi:MAG: hypothetical protein QM764_06200 [Chitinophagaceae bacterium]